jgi:hypothetical protein
MPRANLPRKRRTAKRPTPFPKHVPRDAQGFPDEAELAQLNAPLTVAQAKALNVIARRHGLPEPERFAEAMREALAVLRGVQHVEKAGAMPATEQRKLLRALAERAEDVVHGLDLLSRRSMDALSALIVAADDPQIRGAAYMKPRPPELPHGLSAPWAKQPFNYSRIYPRLRWEMDRLAAAARHAEAAIRPTRPGAKGNPEISAFLLALRAELMRQTGRRALGITKRRIATAKPGKALPRRYAGLWFEVAAGVLPTLGVARPRGDGAIGRAIEVASRER